MTRESAGDTREQGARHAHGADKTMPSNKRHFVVIVGTESRGPPTFWKWDKFANGTSEKHFDPTLSLPAVG